MDKDRFRRRTDYSAPQRRPAAPPPVVDGIDQARPWQPQSMPQTAPMQAQPMQQAPVQQPLQPPRPVAEQPQWKQPTSLPTAQEAATETATTSSTIAVNISLPKLRKPKVPKPSKKAVIITVSILGVALLIAAGAYATIKYMDAKPKVAVTGATAQAKVATSPSYEPVVPKNKTELASTSTAGTGFDGTRNTYSYQDTLSGLAFTVSQQPLPSGSPTPQAAIDKIAKAIGGTTVVKIPNGTKGYISGDVKSGNQVIVFTLHNLLVFIQSPFSHTPADWELYIATLK